MEEQKEEGREKGTTKRKKTFAQRDGGEFVSLMGNGGLVPSKREDGVYKGETVCWCALWGKPMKSGA